MTNSIFTKMKQKSPNTILSFPNMIIRKDKKNLEKLRDDTNSMLKNYFFQKNLRLVIHDNIKENHLGVKIQIEMVTMSSQKICLILLRVVEFLIMKEICLVKRTACLMILLFPNQMLKKLLSIFVLVI